MWLHAGLEGIDFFPYLEIGPKSGPAHGGALANFIDRKMYLLRAMWLMILIIKLLK